MMNWSNSEGPRLFANKIGRLGVPNQGERSPNMGPMNFKPMGTYTPPQRVEVPNQMHPTPGPGSWEDGSTNHSYRPMPNQLPRGPRRWEDGSTNPNSGPIPPHLTRGWQPPVGGPSEGGDYLQRMMLENRLQRPGNMNQMPGMSGMY